MPQSPIALIAFDLDGTVFGSPTNQVVSPRVCAAFQAAHDAGALITVASGRPFWMLGTQIPAAPWLDFAISCNGARVAGTRRCDLDFAASFPRALAENTLTVIAELGGTVSIHTDAESLMETRHCAHLLDDFGERKAQASANGAATADADRGNPIDELLSIFGGVGVDSALDAFLARPAQQLDKVDCAMPSRDTADALEVRLNELGGIGIARLDSKNFELTSARASKGAAAIDLCHELGVDPARAVAFGDSANDLSMCGRALTFVAMGNATAEVKAAADDVTATVWEDGVARWIEERL